MTSQPNDAHLILDRIPCKQRGEITIIQHNTAKREEVQQTVLEVAARRKTDLLAIQEPCTWKEKTTHKFYTISHNMYELILPSNPLIRPRVAVYIRKATNFQYKIRQDLGENSDFLPIEFCGPTERFLFLNVYNEKELDRNSATQPTGTTTIKRSILDLNLQLPFLILGDFNCHHLWWNSQRAHSPTETNDLVHWLQHHNCQLLNEEEPTYFHPKLTTPSIIDLAFFSSNFRETQFDNWSIIEATGSDHVNITFSLFTSNTERFLNPLLSRFNLKHADWESFEGALLQSVEKEQMERTLTELEDGLTTPGSLTHLSPSLRHQADRLAGKLTSCFDAATEHAIPRARHTEHSKPWWTPALSMRRKEMARHLRAFKRNPNSPIRQRAFKTVRNKYFSEIKTAKSECWNTFLKNAQGKEIFQALRFTKEKTTRRVPPLAQTDNTALAEDFQSQCQTLTTTLFPNPPMTAPPDWSHYVDHQWDWPPLERIEIEQAINTSSKKKAPGPDQLSFLILQKAYPMIEDILYRVYNIFFRMGYHPKIWKEATGVVLPKPNKKDYSLPKSYRIISLINCFAKVLEKVMAKRLGYLANTTNLLDDSQMGGRQQRSAVDACLLLLDFIEKSKKEKKKIVSTLFLDVKGAFDHVSKNQLLTVCIQLNLPRSLIHWISSFLEDRTLSLQFNGQTQPKTSIETGIPQGSPVSPILFLIYISNICKTEGTEACRLSYMDDFSFSVASNSAKANCKTLEKIASNLILTARHSAIQFDVDKTELIHFHNKRSAVEDAVQVGTATVKPKTEVRWLGVFFDAKLSFRAHVEKKAAAATRALYGLQRLGNTQRGLSLQAARQLYVACVNSVGDFGVPVWWNKKRASLANRYEKLQHQALIQILGAFKASPTRAMEIEAGLPPPSIRFEKLCNSYALRILKFHHSHAVKRAYLSSVADELETEEQDSNRAIGFLQPASQLEHLASRNKRVIDNWNVEKVSIKCQQPWAQPISARFHINSKAKTEAAEEHLRLLSSLRDDISTNKIQVFYTDGSKKNDKNAAGACRVADNRVLSAKNWFLGTGLEIMDSELVAIQKTLANVTCTGATEAIYVFVDSQAAIKRLQKHSLTGGQETVAKIAKDCQSLHEKGISVHLHWVPSHRNIFGNEMADRLAKAGLGRKPTTPLFVSFSFLKRRVRENTIQDWQTLWMSADKRQGKHYTAVCRHKVTLSLSAPKEKYPKKTQAAFFQLKFGKGFFKSHSHMIGKSTTNQCFGSCNQKQTPQHLVLDCKAYSKERKEMEKELKSSLSLTKLFCTKKGREVLFRYLDQTGIATQRWYQHKDD